MHGHSTYYYPWISWQTFRWSLGSIQFNRSVMSDSLQPHGPQHARLPCPPPTPRACSNACPSSQWCHPNILSSVISFSSCLQSFLASGSFLMSQLFTSDGQNIGTSASASVLPMNIQGWVPLILTGLISWQSKELSRVFSKTTVQKHQFLGAQFKPRRTEYRPGGVRRPSHLWCGLGQVTAHLSSHCLLSAKSGC